MALSSNNGTDRQACLISLGNMWKCRFDRLGDLVDLNKAIDYQTLAAQMTPDDHPDKLVCLNSIGSSCLRRFEHLGHLADIDRAIECLAQAAQLAPNGHTGKPACLNNLGISWQRRFERLDDLADIGKAIDCQAQAVKLIPDGHPSKPVCLNSLGSSFHCRFERLGDPADLDQAISCKTQAAQLTPDNHPNKPICLGNLGNAWQCRFERLGKLTDIDRAIECHAQAVQLTPDSHPEKLSHLSKLGNSQLRRFERLDDLADLDRSIECHTRAVHLTPENHTDKPHRLTRLGTSCLRRFNRLGDLTDINKAVDYQVQAIQLTPDDHPEKSVGLDSLGASLQIRFDRLGDLADLDRAIEYQARAVQSTPERHPDRPRRLANLGISLLSRFKRLGNLTDIDRAIELFAQAARLAPDGHPDKPSHLNNLGISWQSRFDRLSDLADIDRAIERLTQAVQLTPDSHPSKPGRLSNLGISWLRRFERLDDLADIDKAVSCNAQAVQLTPEGHPSKPSRLNNLGNSLQRRFDRHGNLKDIDRATECQAQAVHLTPNGHPGKPDNLSSLGDSWLCRYRYLQQLVDLESACAAYKDGAKPPIVNPRTQLRCARQWAKCLVSLNLTPLQAYQAAFDLLPRLVWLGQTIRERYMTVTHISDLAAEAAAWAVSVQSYDTALEWLEQGRSIVWSQMLQLRTPFDDLSVASPGLASRLKETACQLDAASSPSEGAELLLGHQANLESQARLRHKLALQWEELLAEARQLQGFHEYMLPLKSQKLKKAAIDGPVVIVNTHPNRCDALIIFPQRDNVTHVSLKTLSYEKLDETRTRLLSLIGQQRSGDKARSVKYCYSTTESIDILSLLADLWSDVVGPVLNTLKCTVDSSCGELLHITWCATGALSFLPLHAAGLYDGTSPNAFDLVISSYTPTLSALLPQSNRAASPQAGVLAVGQANSCGQPPLPKTIDELAIIKKHAKATPYHQLDDALATVNATLGAMEEHSWVHLACHAIQNQANPSHSAFYLHDGPLTLEEIAKRVFKNKGLAFLSACQTATGDADLSDEATHLAAGMLMAGYPSVIATMWSILDEDAPEIAEEVYAELMKDGKMDHTNSARALHKAVGKLRERIGVKLIERWAPFVHIGL
ncbi:hypothetical protein FRC07_013568 [Ceratobasidium sp. 392]|nr:hypothetical protein FRC07_013568 [Ceratobasidium sp. 392]